MKKANYGIDAPIVFLSLLAISLIELMAASAFFFLPPPFSWVLLVGTLSSSASFLVAALWMLYSSFFLKPKLIQKMVSSLNLQGDEKVLDIGCGRGLLLITLAKNLPQGKACGIDLWRSKDQSRNSLKNTQKNASLENVKERIELKTADMRSIPYPDHSFDVVVSSLAIHNIADSQEREAALQEIKRLLKPGGTFAILDIQYGKQYRTFFETIPSCKINLYSQFKNYCPPLSFIQGCL